MYKTDMKDEEIFISSSENIENFTGSKESFLGTGNLKNPQKVLNNNNGLFNESCIALNFVVELDPFETKEITLNLGTIEVEDEIPEQFVNIEYVKSKLNETKEYWYELLNRVHVKTPIESINIMLNGWAAYQSITSRLWAKSGYYQSGGAIGFRDQLQDTLGLKYLNSDFMKKQILNAAKHQFIEGDVEHWWHEETGRGIRTRFSDDLLWLP